MAPFQPAGDRARWRVIYDQLTRMNTGDVLTYEAMAGALGLDPVADRHVMQVATRRAAKEYLLVNNRALVPVKNHGYRVTEPANQLTLAGNHQRKALRSVGRGRDLATHVDFSQLDEPTRLLFEAAVWKFSEQDEAMRRLDVRQKRQQRQIDAASSGLEHTASELADLRDRLARLEAERPS